MIALEKIYNKDSSGKLVELFIYIVLFLLFGIHDLYMLLNCCLIDLLSLWIASLCTVLSSFQIASQYTVLTSTSY